MFNEDQILNLNSKEDLKKINYRTRKVIFSDNFSIIDFEDLINKNLIAVEFTNTITEIQDYAFANNHIESIDLSNNLKKLGRGAFSNNNIQEIKIPDSLEEIGPSSFKSNELKNLELGANVKKIGYSAFQGNKLEKFIMGDNLEELGNCCLAANQLTEVVLNNKIKKIFFGTFDDNKIENLIIPENVEEIHNDAFANNQIKSLIIPDSLKRLDSCAFKNNKIENLVIGKGIDTITRRCFYGNELTTVEIPNNIKCIEANAFTENKISNLILNEGLEEIGIKAFMSNNLTSVKIPNSVKTIGFDAFDPCDIYINDIMIDKNLVKKYGTNLIIKLAQIQKLVPNLNYNNIPKEALELVPLDNDSLKGVNLNANKFSVVYNQLKTILYNKVSYETIFKLGYILGAFKGNKIAFDNVVKLAVTLSEDELNKMMNEIELTKYDQKFADTVNEYIKNSNNYNRLLYLVPTFYNNLERIKKGVLKQKENKIAKLNQKVNEGHIEFKEQLDYLKKNKKQITIDEVDHFILTGLFKFSEENKELFKYAHLFNGNIDKEDIPAIEDIYEAAKKVKESNLKCFEEQVGDYTYSWVNNSDPINLVLGYLVDCCAKYKGAGQDIMVQSMTNPNFKNLVIYKGSEVVAKSTAFYNNDYILCNNIEIADAYDKKASSRDKALLLSAYIKAIKKQAELTNVNEVRVGLLRNDLLRQIIEAKYDIERNQMLSNYKFKNYMGDANDPIFGQAIIYKKK